MLTYMSIDTVQHHFWHYMDPSPFHARPQGSSEIRKCDPNVYQRLDQALGELTSRLPDDTVIFVVAPYYWRRAGLRESRLFEPLLAQLGLLKYRENKKSSLRKRATKAYPKRLPTHTGFAQLRSQKKMLANLFPKLRERFEGAYTSYGDIDWAATKAYCSEVLASPPSIWINQGGLKPAGIVDDSEYEPLIALITEKLKALKDPRTGESVIPRIYRRDEVFQGPYSGEAPDLILDWWSKIAFSSSPSFPEEGGQPPLKIRERQPMKDPEWAGTHRLEGILIGKGGPIKKGARLNGARLMDMAPTLLYLAGQKIPSDMDGKVLLELFEPEFVAKNPVEYEQVSSGDQNAGTGSTYSQEDAALVEERLKALGYIE